MRQDKKTGKWEVLPFDFQHKECKGYNLPLDNGQYPFEWVSNYQVITAVHMEPIPGAPRHFRLPADNKKTIVDFLKKMK